MNESEDEIFENGLVKSLKGLNLSNAYKDYIYSSSSSGISVVSDEQSFEVIDNVSDYKNLDSKNNIGMSKIEDILNEDKSNSSLSSDNYISSSDEGLHEITYETFEESLNSENNESEKMQYGLISDGKYYKGESIEFSSDSNSLSKYSDNYDCNLTDSENSSSYTSGGYHPVKIGDIYNDMYRIEAKLGWGYFSTVWLATKIDDEDPSFVAIKIQKSSPSYTEAVYDEISLLKSVKSEKSTSKTNNIHNGHEYIVSYLDHFVISGPNGKHVCVVFEVMGPNLLTLIKLYKFQGVPLNLVRKITKHVLIGLDYLHRVCGIIHTDLKPENILVTTPLSKLTPFVSKLNKVDEKVKIPYVKSDIKPCLSDPSLLTSYEEIYSIQETLYRRPYHHVPWKFMNMMKTRSKHELNPTFYHPKVANEMGVKTVIGDKVICPNVIINTVDGFVKVKPDQINIFEREEAQFKICDLGNVCLINKHFTEEIQTRQYRAPETILKCGYEESVDLWSLACIVFELVTGDYLFDPRGINSNERDFNHLQLIVELLGPIPKNMIKNAKKNKGICFNINKIKRWPLESVLFNKYNINQTDAQNLSNFISCILKIAPKERATANSLLNHEWLKEVK